MLYEVITKYGALLLPVFCTTDDYRHYTIRFQEPFKCDVTDDEEADILRCTQRQSDIIEAAVRERPADYRITSYNVCYTKLLRA